jgi:N-methylhydantoinase A/oxoprolinase/acetone carboxylase beta subunit
MIEGMPRDEIDRVLKGRNFTRFRVEIPVVLLGGPVGAYVEDLRRLINAEFIVPEHADVGNAVGALVGKGIKRVEILIKTRLVPKTREDVPPGEEHCAAPESEVIEDTLQQQEKKTEFIVFSPSERKKFEVYSEALEYAEKLGKQLVMDYMINAGLGKEDIRIDVSRKHLAPSGWTDVPLETKLVYVGVGIPKNSVIV